MPDTTRVLVVEDDRQVAELIQLGLSRGGQVAVTVVDNLADALREACASKVDVVVLDLSLPDASELEALRELVKRGVPIIVITGSSELKGDALANGAADFLAKPVILDVLCGAVKQAALQKKKVRAQADVAAKYDAVEKSLADTEKVEEAVAERAKDLREALSDTGAREEAGGP